MTFIQAVNRVLVKMREVGATNVDDSQYIKLIGQFVNEAMKEVQDAHDWLALRTLIQINTVAGTSEYSLTGSKQDGNILWAYNDTNDNDLFKANWKWMHRMYHVGTVQQESPSHWTSIGTDSSHQLKIKVYPEPDGVEQLSFYCKVPQDQFDLDGSDDDVEITLDSHVIILGAYWRALAERGDDGGSLASEAAQPYSTALSNAIQHDISLTEGETQWQVD